MPSYARWRRFKIVENINSPTVISRPNRGNEIIGGLKNALERGESLEKAKKSFLNAGYRIDEVELALNQIPQVTSKISKSLPPNNSFVSKKKLFGKSKSIPLSDTSLVTKDNNVASSSNVKSSSVLKNEKNAPFGLIIALIIMGILVLGGAVYLALNWKQFF